MCAGEGGGASPPHLKAGRLSRRKSFGAGAGIGSGIGDLNFDNVLSPTDLSDVPGNEAFEEVLYSENNLFNPTGSTPSSLITSSGT